MSKQLLYEKNTINIIICAYNLEPKDISKKIHLYFKKVKKEINLIIVSNKHFSQNYTSNEFTYLSGTNSNLDHSAYYEGLLFCKINNLIQFYTIVCNDNIFSKHDFNFSLESILKYQNLAINFSVPTIVGYRSNYSSVCSINPWSRSPHFLPTYFFALNYFGIEYYMKLYESTLAISSTISNNDYVFKQKLVPFNLLNLLFSHLQFIDSPISWHGLRKYYTDDILVQKKMNCVFFEHYISGLFDTEGAIIYLNTSKKYIILQLLRDFIYKLMNK